MNIIKLDVNVLEFVFIIIKKVEEIDVIDKKFNEKKLDERKMDKKV